MNFGKEILLIIAPHADDEVLGCFGLINKIKKNGGKVFLQILSLGGYRKIEGNIVTKDDWKRELTKVVKTLKIDDYDIAYSNDEFQHIDTIPQHELIGYIESKSKLSLQKIKPTIVAIPTIFSAHQDHTFAYKVSISALRPHVQKIMHMPKLIISYESPDYYFWSSYSEFGKFSPTFYLKLSKDDVKKKSKTFKIYSSQVRENQISEDSITSLARIRGNEIGIDFAESFHIHRFYD
jgi:LmbE family N-acetylglucosaminyl deacetylase